MFSSLDNRHTDSTGPHAVVPPFVARAGHAIGGWVRIVLIALVGTMTLVAALMGFAQIIKSGRIMIADVLLMFIYLEIWAMIVVEATTRLRPVNFIIYIAITGLTRHLVGVAGRRGCDSRPCPCRRAAGSETLWARQYYESG